MNKYGTEPNGGEEADEEEDFVHCNVMSFIFNIYTTCAAGEAIIKLKLGLLMNEIRGILLKTRAHDTHHTYFPTLCYILRNSNSALGYLVPFTTILVVFNSLQHPVIMILSMLCRV
jgi:hypothetical protein